MKIRGYEKGFNARNIQKDLRKYGLLLRECFWCVLKDYETGCKIEVGYDYYMYMLCHPVSRREIDGFAKRGIYIEDMRNVRMIRE